MNVCDNLADHMVGSVYVKFSDEEGAAAALQGLQGRFYGGRPIQIEFSPVTDFREATCRQYEENTCTRGGYCNFMHLRPISRYISFTVISIAVKLKIQPQMHMEEIQRYFAVGHMLIPALYYFVPSLTLHT